MSIKRKISAAFIVMSAALMAASYSARAQEDEGEGAQEEAVAATQPKLAIELGAPFCDNAVLQREMKLPVWGWSTPGTKVTVEFAGQTKTTTAGEDGKWMLELDPLKASFDPAEMVITESTGKTVTLKNILVGEVWMASGQSNMQYKVGGKGINTILLAKAFSEKVKEPVIREFEVTSVFAMLHPIEKATGSWKNGDYENYSAIAFAFAHKLYEELQVPVGILNCSFSQTSIQAWIPREGFATGEDEYTKAIYQKCLETDPTTAEHKAAWAAFYKSLEDQLQVNAERMKKGEAAREVDAKVPGNMSDNRDANWLFNGRMNPVVPYAIKGAIWNQGYANMGEGLPYYNNLHSLIRGWRMVWNKPELPVYFHQFYCPKNSNEPSIDSTSEMRLGTWLARDIPNAGMASQIDISGAIHYSNKTVPGQRLALHALKNQYPSTTLSSAKLRASSAGGLAKDIVADGPMFKSYEVKGGEVIVKFDCAEGGLVVADTAYNRSKAEGATGFADPKVIENGEPRVKLFWLAGEDRVWHPATFEIKGDEVIVKADAVKNPRGVSYASGGIGFQPCLYNKALLPMTPFIQYDNKMVTTATWPDEKLKIAGETIDPSTVGKLYEYRKMPLLSVQFRDNAVFQADKPVTIWGATRLYGEWLDRDEEGDCKVNFEFGDIKKTIPVEKGMAEWSVTLPAMKADGKAYTLKVNFTINGELVHERVATNIIFGDVWYVAAPAGAFKLPEVKPSGQIVRMIENQSNRDSCGTLSRFSICTSRTPLNRLAAYWKDANVDAATDKGKKAAAGPSLAGAIGHTIAAKTGRPVGIIFMQSKDRKGAENPPIKGWIPPSFLNQTPSLMEDYKTVGSAYPDNPYYVENVRRYIAEWKKYWGEYIPEMMRTKAVPDGKPWGSYPSSAPKAGDSKATQVYNVYVASFAPTALNGILFLSSEGMVAADGGANFGPEMSVLANALKAKFGSGDVPFIYTIPAKALTSKITEPKNIEGKSSAVEIGDWGELTKVIDALLK